MAQPNHTLVMLMIEFLKEEQIKSNEEFKQLMLASYVPKNVPVPPYSEWVAYNNNAFDIKDTLAYLRILIQDEIVSKN